VLSLSLLVTASLQTLHAAFCSSGSYIFFSHSGSAANSDVKLQCLFWWFQYNAEIVAATVAPLVCYVIVE